MNDKFLPVGSVILLKGGTKRIMVTGFCSIDDENKEVMYDYTGCLYPEGIINSNEICLFNNDQIDKVYFRGYSDKEEMDFKDKLIQTLSEYQNKNTITVDNDTKDDSTNIFSDNTLKNSTIVDTNSNVSDSIIPSNTVSDSVMPINNDDDIKSDDGNFDMGNSMFDVEPLI